MIARTVIPAPSAAARTEATRPPLAIGALVRWLQAAPRDVVVFARRTPSASPPDHSVTTDLRAGLAAWQKRVALLRVRTVVRRWLVVAAVLAIVLALVDRSLAALPAWFVGAVPLALAALAIGIQSRHTPPLAAVARLADRDLALKEQLASGLEVAEGRSGISQAVLNPRLEARAASLLGQARHAWEVRPIPARGEWAGVVALWAGVVLLLSLPHLASSSRHPFSATGPTVVVPATSAPYRFAFPVPTLPSSSGQTSVRLQIAVVQTPVPAHAGPKAGRPAQSSRPALAARSPLPGARPGVPTPGANTAGKGAKSPNGRGAGLLPGAADAPKTRQQSGVPGSSSVAVYTSRYRVVPPSGNAPTLPGQAGKSQGGPPGRTSSRAASGSQGPGSGAGASRPGTSAANGRIGSNGPPPGSTGLLYTGGRRLLPSQLPKPGLITGKGTFTGKGTPGGLSPGTNRSSGQGRSSSRNTAQAGQGHQLTLQSAYGARRGGDQTSKSIPGKGGPTTGQARVSVGTQQGGLHTIDYVLPDANYVAPGDRAFVSQFFVPRSTG